MKKIAIIEDDKELKVLLEKYLNFQNDLSCETSVESIEEFLSEVNKQDKPDLIICDIGLPGVSGIEGIKILKEKIPGVEVVMLTVDDNSESIFKSLCNGASGYLVKNTSLDKIKESIDIVLNGGSAMSPNIARKVVEYFTPAKHVESELSDRENEIVEGLVEGLSYKLVAHKLDISIDTVRHHIKSIYRKLNVNSKAEVIAKSYKGQI